MKAISLFSGAGGMDVGFENAGFNTVVANELDKDAIATYSLAFPKVDLVGASITDSAAFQKVIQHKSPAVVFGGPPCQGFSVAGKMDPGDERSQLIWRFFDVVEATKPAAFVCENVKALGVNVRWNATRERMFDRARSLGFCSTILILNASDFGVPQARERMFFVGFSKKKHNYPTEAELHSVLLDLLDKRQCQPPTVHHLVSSFGRAGTSSNARVCGAKITFAKNPVLRPSPYAGMLFNGAGRPIRSGGVSCTLPASMGGNKTPIVDEGEIFEGKPSFVEAYHSRLRRGGQTRSGNVPPRLRRLTVDECLAIQTFPLDFEMVGRASSIYRQIGNAVPCKLAGAVGGAVRDILTSREFPVSKGRAKRIIEESLA